MLFNSGIFILGFLPTAMLVFYGLGLLGQRRWAKTTQARVSNTDGTTNSWE
jgi:hypothetical protein